MLNPNSQPWRKERETLDIMALVADLEDHQRVIIEQSFHEGSWDAVFDEARLMGATLRVLKRQVQFWYCQVVEMIEAANAEN